MALFRVQIRKAFRSGSDAYKWSNTWFCDVADPSAACGVGIVIWNAERQFHDQLTWAYEVYASDLVENTQNFTTLPVNPAAQEGQLVQIGEYYRASTVFRVDLSVANGRPSRKFYRIPFSETTVGNGLTVDAAFTAAISAGMSDVFADAGTWIRDESGNALVAPSLRGITDHRLGKFARVDVPSAPA